MSEEKARILSAVTTAGIEAGKAIMDIYDTDFSSTLEIKQDSSPVTAADKEASRIICRQLEGLLDKCPVISEENEMPAFEKRKYLQRYWLIDPLDGTREFIARNGDFTVNIALIEQNVPVFGWILIPLTGEYFYAFRGDGAFHHTPSGPFPIRCNSFSTDQKGLRILRSRSHYHEKAADYIRRFEQPVIIPRGSSIKMMLIASGQADLYPCFSRTSEWDTAAAQIILEEAGGHLLGLETGLPLKYNKKDLKNPFFIAHGHIK